MFEKIRNLKNKKGFTLVELIVVLVILAILAALLVPALTGYIDKAKEQTIIAETRSVVIAAQTIVSEDYGQGTDVTAGDTYITAALKDEILKLAEAKGTIDSMTIQGKTGTTADKPAGKILTLKYTHNNKSCTYTFGDTDPYKVS